MARTLRWRWLSLCLLLGCSKERVLIVDPPWSGAHTAILIERNEAETPVRVSAFRSGPIELAVDPDRVVGLGVLLYPAEIEARLDPVPCGVQLEGDQPIPLVPEEEYSAAPVDLSAGVAPELVAVPEPRRNQTPLSYTRCFPDPYDCARLDPKPHAVDTDDGSFTRIRAIDDDTVFYGVATATSGVPNDFHLVRMSTLPNGEQEHREIPSAGTGLRFRVTAIAPSGDKMLGRTFDGYGFELERDGTGLRRTSGATEFINLSSNGEIVLEHGPGGLRAIAGDVPPLTEVVTDAAVVNERRIAVISGSGIRFFDGTSWRLEHTLFNYLGWGVGGDEDVMVAVFSGGDVLVRNEETGEWVAQGRPFGTQVRLGEVVGLGEGRWLTVGQDGLYGVHTRAGECAGAVLFPNNFDRISISPSGRTVYMGADDNTSIVGDPAYLVRLDLPQD